MAGITKNERYNDLFVESQRNHAALDPKGKRFIIYQGMQFKFDSYEDVEVGCGCDGKPKETVRYYYIDALATCEEGQYLWPKPKGGGSIIVVTSKYFIETESIKYPAVVNDYEDETSGKDTDLFTPPWERNIPREGGLSYTDPWDSVKDS